MKNIHKVEFKPGTKEELLPDFSPAFPCVTSCVEIDRHIGKTAPWHWHRAVELFYIESGGALEYNTPSHVMAFPAGSGGFVNSNVLHMTRPYAGQRDNRQLLHIFDPSFISGGQGTRMEQRYVLPLISASQVEILPLFPEDPAQAEILELIRRSFQLDEGEPGYELRLRALLSEIWLRLLEVARPMLGASSRSSKENGQVKQMMIYIREHLGEKIAIGDLAAAAFVSERACFRLFQQYLHMTPAEYIRSCRLQTACRMLAATGEPVTEIASVCGLGSSSYFGKIFREAFGCTPLQYRGRWQDCDNSGR